jgi:hypothetical protein
MTVICWPVGISGSLRRDFVKLLAVSAFVRLREERDYDPGRSPIIKSAQALYTYIVMGETARLITK